MLATFLATTPLFEGLDQSLLEELAGSMTTVPIEGGESLFTAGEPADAMFVILHGRLRVYNDTADKRELLAEVGRGDILGEMALLTGGTRSASVVASRDSELLRLTSQKFEELSMRHPELLMVIARRAIGRYQEVLASGGRAPQPAVKAIALVGTNQETDLRPLADALVSGLKSLGTVAVVGKAELKSKFDTDFEQETGADLEQLKGFLHNLEELHDFVVYVADPTLTSWSKRCLRQADRFILVGARGGDPAPGEVELALTKRQNMAPGGVLLALLHNRPAEFYPGTAAWLNPRKGIAFHHVCPSVPADCDRLARVVAGRTMGLVLGGGGARCFSQIGVLRALQECGYHVDFVGGTSMGAFIALLHALGWNVDRIHEYNRECWVKLRPLRDFTLPYVGMISGRKFTKMVETLLGDHHLEDIRLNYFCCASNLSEAKVAVLDRGLASRWLGASMAVPGVAPPVFDSGRLFIDGALLANLPTDIMAKRCSGSVMAVDVTPEIDVLTNEAYTEPPSSWKLWGKRLNPFSEAGDVPTLVEVVGRATALAGLRRMHKARSQADLLMTPPINDFALFEWDAIDKIAEVGYQHALPILQDPKTRELLTGTVVEPELATGTDNR